MQQFFFRKTYKNGNLTFETGEKQSNEWTAG